MNACAHLYHYVTYSTYKPYSILFVLLPRFMHAFFFFFFRVLRRLTEVKLLAKVILLARSWLSGEQMWLSVIAKKNLAGSFQDL